MHQTLWSMTTTWNIWTINKVCVPNSIRIIKDGTTILVRMVFYSIVTKTLLMRGPSYLYLKMGQPKFGSGKSLFGYIETRVESISSLMFFLFWETLHIFTRTYLQSYPLRNLNPGLNANTSPITWLLANRPLSCGLHFLSNFVKATYPLLTCASAAVLWSK